MKIKGMFIIPLVAIMIAMFTLGVVPGMASDTTATETTLSDTLTYIPTTFPPTSSMEEELEGFVSNAFGDDLQQAGNSIKGFSKIMAGLLASFHRILDAVTRIFKASGGIIGSVNFGEIFGTSGLF